jgi:HEPN domain-containing protein
MREGDYGKHDQTWDHVEQQAETALKGLLVASGPRPSECQYLTKLLAKLITKTERMGFDEAALMAFIFKKSF